jgi:hypothetical protein
MVGQLPKLFGNETWKAEESVSEDVKLRIGQRKEMTGNFDVEGLDSPVKPFLNPILYAKSNIPRLSCDLEP